MSIKTPFSSRPNSRVIDYVMVATITIGLILAYKYLATLNNISSATPSSYSTILSSTPNQFKFGFNLNDYAVDEGKIKNNQFLGDILYKNGISYSLIAELEEKAKSVYDVRKIRSGKNYALIREDSCYETIALVYEPDPLRYVIYDFRDSVSVHIQDRDFVTCIETASGKLESSLWDAIVGKGYSAALVDLMEDALASSVDFYHTQKGDEFKVIYEKNYIDDVPATMGKVLAAYYKNQRGEHHAIYFESGNYEGFFDYEGRPSKKAFLRSPVKYSRISSRFTYSRFHPVKKRRIPHLGTDYAAPRGTPIRSVADGVIIKASYTKGNGKYVKVKHDRTYETQYLHMSRFAKGIVPGQTVKRGETIGYVGSTGLATGPHVCFRFWKNGRQVDHFRENFPPPDPMPEEYLPKFYETRANYVDYLNQISVLSKNNYALMTNNPESNT